MKAVPAARPRRSSGSDCPAERLPAHPAIDPRAALLDVLGGLPTPAPARLWGTTVVVGPAQLARRAVDSLVERTGGTGQPARQRQRRALVR